MGLITLLRAWGSRGMAKEKLASWRRILPKEKKGLGRGLASLLPEETLETEKEIFFCPVEAIRPSPYQPRLKKEEGLEELVASIKAKGIIQPLLVREVTPGIYELVAGERRFEAAKKAGLKRVPVIVRELTPQEALELALIENLQRKDLNPIEEALGYERLIREFGLTQEEVAQKVGRDRSTVANSLRLLKLPQDIQEDILAGKLSAGHARALLALPTEELMRKVKEEILERGLSVRQTEALVKKILEEKKVSPPPKDPNLEVLEKELAELLGTKVRLSWGKKKGRLTIEFYSTEQFENFLEQLRHFENR